MLLADHQYQYVSLNVLKNYLTETNKISIQSTLAESNWNTFGYNYNRDGDIGNFIEGMGEICSRKFQVPSDRYPVYATMTCHKFQDGSFNGLQHYAALGRDQTGAMSVNLSPTSHPSDVYSDVAEMVEKMRQVDAENGLKVAQELEGFIKRKVRKVGLVGSVRWSQSIGHEPTPPFCTNTVASHLHTVISDLQSSF